MTSPAGISNLDIEDTPVLLDYLRRRGAIGHSESPLVRKLEGGVSNRVVLVKRNSGESFVLKQALEKLRVRVDWFCTPTRIEHEALALRHLRDLAPDNAVPALIFQDSENHLLAMAEIPQPHRNWKQMLLNGELYPDHVKQFGVLLGNLHRQSAARAEPLREIFDDRAVFDALRLEPYYRYSASQVPESAPFLAQLITDTLACRLAVVHADYSPKNVLIHQDRLVLLDYEVVHFGDPAFDVGFSTAHLLGKANHLRIHRAAFLEAAVLYWQSYAPYVLAEKWAAELEQRAVRHCAACCLARVVGRSPLEYLTKDERVLQAGAALEMLKKMPATIEELVSEFGKRLSCR